MGIGTGLWQLLDVHGLLVKLLLDINVVGHLLLRFEMNGISMGLCAAKLLLLSGDVGMVGQLRRVHGVSTLLLGLDVVWLLLFSLNVVRWFGCCCLTLVCLGSY